MEPEHESWLARRWEDPLDPDQLIYDPHHHLWDHPGNRYLLEELRADTGSGHRVERTVFVECMSAYRRDGPEAFRPVGETELVAALAATSDRTADEGAVIAGTVGHVDLRSPEVADVLAAHLEADGARFCGIRHASAWDPSPDLAAGHSDPPAGLFAEPAFRNGFAALSRAGLSFDAWLYHPQLPELVDLARAHPDVVVVLDHLGGPLGIGPYSGRRSEVLDVWRVAMEDVARCPNVNLKLGGIGMPIFGLGWHHRPDPPSSQELADAWGSQIRWCIEVFGPERCMFESNFPVDKRSCSYVVLWNAFKRIIADASPAEKAALFHGTASRIYHLGP